MRRMRISTFEPIPNPITFRQHHVMERFFSLCLPMRAPSCVPFWVLPTWTQSSRLRLIERRASYAPCSILHSMAQLLQPVLLNGVPGTNTV